MSGRLNAANAVLTVPTVIGGRPIPFDETTARAILDMCGAPALKLAVADKWTMVAAKGAASHAQAMLANVPRVKIVNLLARAMDFYFPDRNAYRIISGITGSPLPFVESGLEYVKDWCRSGRVFLDAALPQSTPHIGHIEYSNSRPVVAVLPSNSDQVAVYTVAQILYSRNACIVRGSSKGIGPWATYELANALSQAAAESNDEDCAVVASSLSVLNTELNYLDHLSVSGWNYLIFGSDESTRLFESDLRARCNPGKVLKFGTGLSQSVVLDDCDLAESASKVWESITINCGNECTSTDILYIQAGVCEQVLSSLSEKASSAPQTRSHDADVLGGGGAAR